MNLTTLILRLTTILSLIMAPILLQSQQSTTIPFRTIASVAGGMHGQCSVILPTTNSEAKIPSELMAKLKSILGNGRTPNPDQAMGPSSGWFRSLLGLKQSGKLTNEEIAEATAEVIDGNNGPQKKAETKSHILAFLSNLGSLGRQLLLPEGAIGMVAFSTALVIGILMAAQIGILPAAAGFSITALSLGLGLATGYVLGVGLKHTDNAIDSLTERVQRNFPERQAQIEAMSSNLPEAVMGMTFFAVTLSAAMAAGTPLLVSIATASLVGGAVPMGSFFMNGTLRVAASIWSMLKTIFTKSGRQGIKEQLTTGLESYAAAVFPIKYQSVIVEKGKKLGFFSTPMLFAQTFISFMHGILAQHSRAVKVFALSMVPVMIFNIFVLPQLALGAAMSLPTVLVGILATRAAMSAFFYANDKIMNPNDYQATVFGGNLDSDQAAAAIEYIATERVALKQLFDSSVITLAELESRVGMLELLSEYISAQDKLNTFETPTFRRIAMVLSAKIESVGNDLVTSETDQVWYTNLIQAIDQQFGIVATSQEAVEDEESVFSLESLVRDIQGVQLSDASQRAPLSQRLSALASPVAYLFMAVGILGAATFMLEAAGAGISPIIISYLAAFLSSAPEFFQMLGKLEDGNAVGSDIIVTESNATNGKIWDLFFTAGTSIWARPAINFTRSFVR